MAKREGGGAKVGLKQRVENRECAITKQKMSLGCDGVAWTILASLTDYLPLPCAPLCICGEKSRLFSQTSPGFHRPAFSPAQPIAFNDYLGNRAYKELFPGSSNVSPSYRSPITKLWHRSVLAELEKQHTQMIFSTIYTVELKHDSFRHQCRASGISPKVIWDPLASLSCYTSLLQAPTLPLTLAVGQPGTDPTLEKLLIFRIISSNCGMWKQVCNRKKSY